MDLTNLNCAFKWWSKLSKEGISAVCIDSDTGVQGGHLFYRINIYISSFDTHGLPIVLQAL